MDASCLLEECSAIWLLYNKCKRKMFLRFAFCIQSQHTSSMQGNTFQGMLVTDGMKSFMVSTFRGQGISWYDTEVRIGYMGDQTHFLFGPLDNSSFYSLYNDSLAKYYNEVYQLSIDGATLTLVQPGKKNILS